MADSPIRDFSSTLFQSDPAWPEKVVFYCERYRVLNPRTIPSFCATSEPMQHTITYFFKSEIIPLSSSCKVNFVHVSSVEEPVGSYLAPAPKNKIVGSGSRSVFYKLTTVLNSYRTESLHCLVEFLRFLCVTKLQN